MPFLNDFETTNNQYIKINWERKFISAFSPMSQGVSHKGAIGWENCQRISISGTKLIVSLDQTHQSSRRDDAWGFLGGDQWLTWFGRQHLIEKHVFSGAQAQLSAYLLEKIKDKDTNPWEARDTANWMPFVTIWSPWVPQVLIFFSPYEMLTCVFTHLPASGCSLLKVKWLWNHMHYRIQSSCLKLLNKE